MKTAALCLALVPLLASGSPLSIETIHDDAAPVLSSVHSKEVPNSYVIKFKPHIKHEHATAHHSWEQKLHLAKESDRAELRKRSQNPIVDEMFKGLRHTYKIGDFLGYSGHFDEETIEEIRRHPDVEYIEKDSEVHTMGDDYETEKNAPWGLARISHRESLTFGTAGKYLYSGLGGEGVDAYIIDTGTSVNHVDFEGRATWGKTIPENDPDEDGNGHGTHCSGTVAGKKYGVAKKANIYAVKVLRSNGSGTMSDVVKGVEWAAEQHEKKVEEYKKSSKGKKKFKGSVANMSLGGGKAVTLDRAVNAAVELGLHFAVAAGNDNADSCNYSPAAAEKAVTVGASTLWDERAYFSNFGKCNDIFAPGLNIQSTWIGSNTSTNTISGTSMASPHIAGLLAYMLSLQPSKDSAFAVADISPKKLKENLISIATSGALEQVPADTSNVLAWNGGGNGNYSDIIHKGGYTARREPLKPISFDIDVSIEDLESEIKVHTGEVKDSSRRLKHKVDRLAHEIEDLVFDEIDEIFDEVKDRFEHA